MIRWLSERFTLSDEESNSMADVAEDEGFLLRPPDGHSYRCPFCSTALEEIFIAQHADHGHIGPCGCRIEPEQMTALFQGAS